MSAGICIVFDDDDIIFAQAQAQLALSCSVEAVHATMAQSCIQLWRENNVLLTLILSGYGLQQRIVCI